VDSILNQVYLPKNENYNPLLLSSPQLILINN
jgi:hypothetical protein